MTPRHSQRVDAFADHDPPLAIGAGLAGRTLRRAPMRIALAGAGAAEAAAAVAGIHPDLVRDPRWRARPPLPVFGHADAVKCEVLEWVAQARARSLAPGERATFVSFCDFLGISPGIVERDLWEVVGETWNAMDELLEAAAAHAVPVRDWAGSPATEETAAKVAFVDRREAFFGRSLRAYAQAIREISGNPACWAERTVDRGLAVRACLNADTRLREEMETLRAAGWVGVLLAGEAATGFGLEAGDCDASVDAGRPLGRVVLDVAEWLAARAGPDPAADGE